MEPLSPGIYPVLWDFNLSGLVQDDTESDSIPLGYHIPQGENIHYENLPMQYMKIFWLIKIKKFSRKILIFLAHVGSQGELDPASVRRPSVRPQFQRSSSLKPLGQPKPNFI